MAAYCDDTWHRKTRFLDLADEPCRMLAPLEGFASKPLVTLEEALLPVSSFFSDDLRRYSYVAKEQAHFPNDEGISQDEAASIYVYTMDNSDSKQALYYVLNQTLRTEDRRMVIPWFYYLKLILCGLCKIVSIRRTVYRAVNMNLMHQYPVGKTCVWWGFSSCSSSIKVLENNFLGESGERTVFMIDCENGKDIRKYSHMTNEDEILLLPGTQLEVVDHFVLPNNFYIIHLKEVEPPYPLREKLFTELSTKKTTTIDRIYERMSNMRLQNALDEIQPHDKALKESSIEEVFDAVKLVGPVSFDSVVESLRPLLDDIDRKAYLVEEKFKEAPVSKLKYDEFASIMLYTMQWEPQQKSLYFILNAILRQEDAKQLHPWLPYLKLLFNALASLSSFNDTVYRGVPKDLRDIYSSVNSKTVFTWWTFTSCSTVFDVAKSFAKDGEMKTLFNIKCINGKNIQPHSFYQCECEILLPAGTKLKYVDSRQIQANTYMVELEEVWEKVDSSLSKPIELEISVDLTALHDSTSYGKPELVKNANNGDLMGCHMHLPNSKESSKAYSETSSTNVALEELINNGEPEGSDVNLSDFGKLNDSDMRIVVEQAFRKKQCSTIYLRNNAITSESVRILADGLVGNKTLTGIFFYGNPLGDDGSKYLADALSCPNAPSSLTSLTLGQARIGDKGAVHFAEMLQRNTTLVNLNLWKNDLSNQGVIAITQALIQNPQSKLAHLNLSYNISIGDECTDMLIELIEHTQILKELNLIGCSLSSLNIRRLQTLAQTKECFVCHTNRISSVSILSKCCTVL